MSIHLLPPEIASQIAAGEVVERPASVVKELLENALDAGATNIHIQIEGGGQRLVEVADNGAGIPADEIVLATARHATSKLVTAEDLFNIRTLGFRGEALASIGSVSRFTITSRPADAAAAMRLRVEGGSVGIPEPVGAPLGTVVRVEDLFYNVPARLKFMKTEATERRQIDTLVTQYALAYAHVRFQLQQEGRVSLQTTGNSKRREVLAALYGVDVARGMLEVLAEEDGLQVTGFTSPTSLTRSNRREITFFINGRPVQDLALTTAVLQAYHTLLMVGRFPLGTLFLELDPAAVDVNVHPTKAEVRFRDSSRIFSGVQRAVRRALLAHTPVPEMESTQLRWSPTPTWQGQPQKVDLAWEMARAGEPAAESEGETGAPPAAWGGESGTAGAHVEQPGVPSRLGVPLLRLVGQVASTYLVAEGPDGLYLIDQHAAHERVLFERFMAQRQAAGADGALPAQILLQPATVNLPAASARLLESQLPVLKSLGFQVEAFGPGTFLVRAIPVLLSGMDPAAALRVLVEDFEEDETPLQAELESRVIARVCKRAAVKAGQTLSNEEQRSLLTELEATSSPRTCPHGRPTMIHLAVDVLERQFGRKGAR